MPHARPALHEGSVRERSQGDGEQCDCGTDPTNLPTGCTGPNGLLNGDGTCCTNTCHMEPNLPRNKRTGTTHACTGTCGDGNINPGEECDDGNLVDGDGCSSTCQIEPGFTCTTQTNSDSHPCTQTIYSGNCLDLQVKYRDFQSEHEAGGHPDFFYYGATLQRLASSTSAACRDKPIH